MENSSQIGDKTYIYALKNKDKDIIYIGKSCTPKSRLSLHKQYVDDEKNISMEILGFFYDIESFWIKKYLNEGHPLKNKLPDVKCIEIWNVGDIITTDINTNKVCKIFDKEKNIMYKSIYSLSKELNVDYDKLKIRLNNPNKYPEYKHYEYK